MKIKKLSFKNNKTGWSVKDVNFSSLTLLVGASGVGKTQILKVLSTLSSIAEGRSYNGREWNIQFEESNIEYTWSGRFELVDSDQPDFFENAEYAIFEEKLTANSKIIFSRNSSELLYHDQPTVKLDSSKSAIELLKEENDIAVVNKAFKKINWLRLADGERISFGPWRYKNMDTAYTLSEIKNLKFRSAIDKLFLIQKNDIQSFNSIKESFQDIFPLVEDIDFEIASIFKDEVIPLLKIKEFGVNNWIKQPEISSGMYRTLSQIVTLTLADDGDVILIDEFENGLGINCIDNLADMALEPDANIQIIMTSHHPYIINAIPFNDWRIVSRTGSNVSVNTAKDLNLGTHSKHDAFMQLIQTSAYKTGQS